ncbi:alpha/beta fold hydrolase [Paenibacillus sp. KN14-4R]|uniref:alpha/beta hydrolase n=1 Tax=Paenibacillus sp. KN14-4R TaxID=3445773 RepID=UPI003F9EEBFD
MRKVWKVLRNILIALIALILIVSAAVFIYHKYQLSKESALLSSKGTLVDFDNKKINVYNEGSGGDTYVLMPGSGIAAPIYEMKGLYSKFSKDNKIAIIERAGYGYSDVLDDDRDLDRILEQSREALIRSGNQPPYVLMPHSMSGLEAIYWAQKYPDEVKAIIAMDIGLPQDYVTYKMSFVQSLNIRAMNVFTKIGFHRFLPSSTYNEEVLKQSFLTDQEKEIFKAISFKMTFNDDMLHELLQIDENAKKSVARPLPKGTPILFLAAYTDQNEHSAYNERKNKSYEELASQLSRSEVKRVKGKHSIYLYAPDEIYKLATDFIKK